MLPLADGLLNNLWPGLAVWGTLYVSDYMLTIRCARLYQAEASKKLVFEGSFELTPYYQRDIDALKVVSPRFIGMLMLGELMLALAWFLAMRSLPELYHFCLGALVATQLAVHVRHFRNLFLFRAIAGTDAVRGRIEYSRPLVLRMSALELLAFSGLFAVLFAFTQSWFVLGGAVKTFSIAMKHRKLASKYVSTFATVSQTQPAS